MLKGIAAHYVMRADDRVALMERQRTLLAELFEVLAKRGSDALDPALRADYEEASDEPARTRVLLDQVASLTDASALTWHQRLVGRGDSRLGVSPRRADVYTRCGPRKLGPGA